MNEAQHDPRATIERIIGLSAFSTWMGVRIGHCAPGEIEVTVDVRPEHLQRHGYVHGAVVGYMADTACAWAAATTEGNVVTAEYKLNFLRPATGERLVARGTTIRASRRQIITRADVYAVQENHEKIVATALATIMRVESE